MIDGWQACAAIVQKGDADRFAAVMAAPVTVRAPLFVLYAFNVEVSRAPWVTQETMIAEMRLQWWRDVLDQIASGAEVGRHEVATPLAAVLSAGQARQLQALVEARQWDIYRDPFEDQAAMDRYFNATSGALMQVAADLLGQAESATVADYAYAAGVANWLRATRALEDQGRVPLLEGTSEGVRALAQRGLARLGAARGRRAAVSRAARVALLPGWQSAGLLRLAIKDPARVAEGTLALSPLRRSLGLSWQAVSGRF